MEGEGDGSHRQSRKRHMHALATLIPNMEETMQISRRLAIAGLFILQTTVAFAGENAYLTAADIDLKAMLPPPPAADSVLGKADVDAVIAAQKAATPERIALAKHDAEETVYVIFGKILGDKVNATATPLTDKLFARIGASEDEVVDPAKPYFARVRPFLAYPNEIKDLVKASKSGSYPSGHTTRATVEGIILGMMVPEKRGEIWTRVAEYAESRVVGGMHYPGDLAAGRQSGVAMAATLLARPSFVADMEAAKKELRAALGL